MKTLFGILFATILILSFNQNEKGKPLQNDQKYIDQNFEQIKKNFEAYLDIFQIPVGDWNGENNLLNPNSVQLSPTACIEKLEKFENKTGLEFTTKLQEQ